MSSRHATRSILALVSLALLLAASAVPAAAATYRFTIRLDSECVSGHGPANDDLAIILRSSAGTFLASTSVTTDGSGRWNGCFEGDRPLRSGRKIRATNGSTGRTYTIPSLTARTDRGDDTVRGRAPASSSVRVRVYDCHTDLVGDCALKVSRLRTTSSTGAYLADVTAAYNARGRDLVRVTFTSPAGDVVSRSGNFPHFSADPGRGIISGLIYPSQSTIITLLDEPGGSTLFSGSVTADAQGNVGASTLPDLIVEGNQVRVSFESDARITIPDTALTYGISAANTIAVRCLPNRPVLLYWDDIDAYGYQVTADGSGDASLDVVAAGEDALSPLAQITAECVTAAGDALVLFTVVPPI